MDDLSEKLDKLLGSEDGMKRIEDMMAAFGVTPSADTAPPPSPAPDTGFDLSMILKLMPVIESLSKPDDNAALLYALRPHLQHERQKKLDEAANMMKLMKMLPLIKGLAGKEDDA